MSEILKPCPFCGGTNICTEKGINLNYCDSCSAEANIEHWNTRPLEDVLQSRIAELKEELDRRIAMPKDLWFKVAELSARVNELELAQRWIPVSERLPDGGHREFYEVACIHQVFGELALFSKGRWVIYEGENVYDVTKQVKFWRNRQHLPDEVIAVISKGEMNPEVQE